MNLIADLVYGDISVYLPIDNGRNLLIYGQGIPLEGYVENSPSREGRKIRSVEEPLVNFVLHKNIPMQGKKEYVLGALANQYIYPLRDQKGECFGAIVFLMRAQQEIAGEAMQVEAAYNMLLVLEVNSLASWQERVGPNAGIMLVDVDTKVLTANESAKRIFTVFGLGNVEGQRLSSVKINWPLVAMAIKSNMAECKEFQQYGLHLFLQVVPFLNKGRVQAFVVVEDRTQLDLVNQQLEVQAAVIKEIHHRVKNNLQTIVALMQMQERRAVNQETKQVLLDCMNRVRSIATVHDYLSHQEEEQVELGALTKAIVGNLLQGLQNPQLQLATNLVVEELALNAQQANAYALCLNELVQNALTHGLAEAHEGTLVIELKQVGLKVILVVKNTGRLLPKGFEQTRLRGMGLKIITTLAQGELKGSFVIENQEEKVVATIEFPLGLRS